MMYLGGVTAEFHPYAKCDSDVFLFDAGELDVWDVPVLQATLSLSAPIDTYEDHYNYVAAGTGSIVNYTSGQSKLEVTLAVMRESGVPFSTKAHIHASRCETNQGGSHFLQDVAGIDGGDNIFLVEHSFSGGVPSPTASNVTRDYLVDYERAESVVVHAPDGTRLACCNLAPNLPTLPNTWSAVIEANINHEGDGLNSLSYSMLRYEWYDASTNNLRIDEHSSYSKQTRIMNAERDTIMFLHKNDTHPSGYCEDHKVSDGHFPMFGRGSGNGLSSTAEFLRVTGDTPDEYHGVTEAGVVRGIPCEKWTRNVTMPSFRDPTRTISYLYEFYFPVSSWMVRRESFHRMLSRIVVRSDSGMRGVPVTHFYDFIDFKPEVDVLSIFNPCEIYNSGALLSGNCTCGVPGFTAPSSSTWESSESSDIDAIKAQLQAMTAVVVVLALVIIGGFGGSAYFRWREENNAKALVNDNEMSSF
jgi:hypothetical protein